MNIKYNKKIMGLVGVLVLLVSQSTFATREERNKKLATHGLGALAQQQPVKKQVVAQEQKELGQLTPAQKVLQKSINSLITKKEVIQKMHAKNVKEIKKLEQESPKNTQPIQDLKKKNENLKTKFKEVQKELAKQEKALKSSQEKAQTKIETREKVTSNTALESAKQKIASLTKSYNDEYRAFKNKKAELDQLDKQLKVETNAQKKTDLGKQFKKTKKDAIDLQKKYKATKTKLETEKKSLEALKAN